MGNTLDVTVFKIKSFLCIILMLYAPLLMCGCGQSSDFGILPPDALVGTPFEAGHPLAKALEGSRFSDATSIDLDPKNESFSLVFPASDESRRVFGLYTSHEGKFTITELHIEADGVWVEMTLDTQKRVTRLLASTGEEWVLPKEDAALATRATSEGGQTPGGTSSNEGTQTTTEPFSVTPSTSDGVQEYLDANAGLLAVAEQYDREAAQDAADGLIPGKKTGTAFFIPALLVLAALAPIWGVVGLAGTLMGVFTLANVLQSQAAVVRFDGIWNIAGPQGAATIIAGVVPAPTIVEIKEGRIVDLASAAQTWDILKCELLSAVATNVQWRVLADVELTPLPAQTTARVELIFDLNEITGSPTFLMQGTLTMNVDGVLTTQTPVQVF